jgi:glycine/D-amino acid oxidase-like deaminating enzyme
VAVHNLSKIDHFYPTKIITLVPGLQVIEHCPVTNVVTEDHSFNTKKVSAVETKFGTIKTKHVVNCTGAWGNDIANMVRGARHKINHPKRE